MIPNGNTGREFWKRMFCVLFGLLKHLLRIILDVFPPPSNFLSFHFYSFLILTFSFSLVFSRLCLWASLANCELFSVLLVIVKHSQGRERGVSRSQSHRRAITSVWEDCYCFLGHPPSLPLPFASSFFWSSNTK